MRAAIQDFIEGQGAIDEAYEAEREIATKYGLQNKNLLMCLNAQGKHPHLYGLALRYPKPVEVVRGLLWFPRGRGSTTFGRRFTAVGRITIYELIGRGELPAVKIGRCTRFRLGDLAALVDRKLSTKVRGQVDEIWTKIAKRRVTS